MGTVTVSIRIGHVLDKLAELPDESVHCVWTSPPYWGLRAYGTEPQVWGGDPGCEHQWGEPLRTAWANAVPGPAARAGGTNPGKNGDGRRNETKWTGPFCARCGAWRGEHGQEPTLDLWLQHEVMIFREVRRVLRKDGTLWLNCGDAYATHPAGNKRPTDDDRTFRERPFSTVGGKRVTAGKARGDVDVGGWGASDDSLRWRGGGSFKAKDRLMLPARLAIALHDDGWYLRDEIVWSKANPMPSSVKDRTTPAHEMIYLLTRAPRYFFDHVAIMEPIAEASVVRYSQPTINGQRGGTKQDAYETGVTGQRSGSRRPNEIIQDLAGQGQQTRQKRSVWHMALEPFDGAHFATAPTGIVRPCILAGTSAKGVCPHCGAPWVRLTAATFEPQPDVSEARGIRCADGQKPMDASNGWDGFPRGSTEYRTTGWRPSCVCPEHKPIPATVLDPFGGAGTTGLVADELGRDCILIELNPESARIARDRIREALGRVASDMPETRGDDLPLFGATA